jgi:hypothetical protein
MAAGDMTAGENHHHERGADGERGERAGIRRNHRAADGENEEERADKFDEVFFHRGGGAW